MLKVEAISAFQDNYIWAITDGQTLAVVDPGDAQPVLNYLKQNKLPLTAILVTHHHSDHIGGIPELLANFPQCKVYAPAKNSFSFNAIQLNEGDSVKLENLGEYTVLEVPGHTLGHIAFYGEGKLFIGDTVFACGCGRLFEGTPEQMVNSFEKIRQLPKETQIYCAHEYTLSNIRFAKVVDSQNQQLLEREKLAISLRNKSLPTVPFTLAEELATNPFFGYEKSEIRQTVSQKFNLSSPDSIATFAALRQWKNNF